MKQFFIIFIIFISCTPQTSSELIESVDTTTEKNNDFLFITPISCSATGEGCEMLYLKNANKGYKDVENKDCNGSNIEFNFDKKYKFDFAVFVNFKDDKYKKSGKPKTLDIYVNESSVRAVISSDTNFQDQYVYFPEKWGYTDTVNLNFRNSYFDEENVEYCGVQNIFFYGYEYIDE